MHLITILITLFSPSLEEDSMTKVCYQTYKGQIENYELEVGEKVITVPSSNAELRIQKDEMFFENSGLAVAGPWQVIKNDNNYKYIEASMSNGHSINFKIYLKVNSLCNRVIFSDSSFKEERGQLQPAN